MLAASSLAALALAYSVAGMPSPLTPTPSPAGGNCVISWTPDPTGTWTQTNIELMSGDNQQMVHLTTVTTIDTTSATTTSFTWTCPDVTLYSAVYFYQFSHAAEPNNLTWTTRWAIESPTGEIVAPPNATQPDGTAIAWGLGLLKDFTTAKPAPSYITGQLSQTSATGTSASGSSGAVVGSTSVSVSATSTMTMAMAKTSAPSMAMATVKSTASVSESSAAPAATTTQTSSSGAERSAGSILMAGIGAVFTGLLALV